MQLFSAFPDVLVIVSWFSAVFCVAALIAQLRWERRGVWVTWAVFVPMVSGACVAKLSGMTAGVATSLTVTYYVLVTMAALGMPMLISALMLVQSQPVVSAVREAPLRTLRAAARAWVGSLIVTPVAALTVGVLDRYFQVRIWGL